VPWREASFGGLDFRDEREFRADLDRCLVDLEDPSLLAVRETPLLDFRDAARLATCSIIAAVFPEPVLRLMTKRLIDSCSRSDNPNVRASSPALGGSGGDSKILNGLAAMSRTLQ